MDLAVPVGTEPMLARLARTLPAGRFCFEPKWDGFRALAFRAGDEVELRSRNQRPFARYFPEVVEALRAVEVAQFVVDGELMAWRDGAPDFAALMLRLHPSPTRVARLRHETPATFVLFDALQIGEDDLRMRPFHERRARLCDVFGDRNDVVSVTPATDERDAAAAWLDARTPGIDGVVAKAHDLTYQPAKRAMVKVKRERTLDCVVAGARLFAPGDVASLLLALYGDDQLLHSIGVVASFNATQRAQLWRDVEPSVIPLARHPWANGFVLSASPVGRLRGAAGRWTPDLPLDWVPLEPTRVCEVAYDHFDGDRLRHPPRWRRWRPDRDARSCTFEQVRV